MNHFYFISKFFHVFIKIDKFNTDFFQKFLGFKTPANSTKTPIQIIVRIFFTSYIRIWDLT